eukprot:2767324-Prymnesium_polylepis.2
MIVDYALASCVARIFPPWEWAIQDGYVVTVGVIVRGVVEISVKECRPEPQVGSQHDSRETDATYDGVEELRVVCAACVNDRRDAVLHGEHVERLRLVVRRGGPMVVDVVGNEAAYRLARICEEAVALGTPLAPEQLAELVHERPGHGAVRRARPSCPAQMAQGMPCYRTSPSRALVARCENSQQLALRPRDPPRCTRS